MEIVIRYLKRYNCDYFIQYIGAYNYGNIIVDFSKGKEYFLFLAHYDSVEGSSGINDNATGVSVLIDLINRCAFANIEAKIVFTTLEEKNGLGCECFLRNNDISKIKGVINIDSCGWGDIIVVGNRKKDDVFKFIKKYDDVYMCGFLPYGDDAICEDYNIPTISISTMTMKEYKCFLDVYFTISNKLEASSDLVNEYKNLGLFQTMHNGTLDNEHCLNMKIIYKVTDVVERIIQSL
jgi:Iap family predicted aminopeptidase